MADADPDAAAAAAGARLARGATSQDEAPSVVWTLVALAGLAAWIGCALGLVLRGVGDDDRLRPRVALGWAAGAAVGLVTFFVGLCARMILRRRFGSSAMTKCSTPSPISRGHLDYFQVARVDELPEPVALDDNDHVIIATLASSRGLALAEHARGDGKPGHVGIVPDLPGRSEGARAIVTAASLVDLGYRPKLTRFAFEYRQPTVVI